MRKSKLHHSLALCLSLSLSGLTACEFEAPTPGDQESGETLKDKVVDTLTGAQQGSGAVELRMVDLGELSARALPALDTSDMQAEITVKAIAVRRCLKDDEEVPEQQDPAATGDDTEQEGDADDAGQDTGDQDTEAPEDLSQETSEPSQDESEPNQAGIMARKGKKTRPADRRDDQNDRVDPPEDADKDLPEPELPEPDLPQEDLDQLLAEAQTLEGEEDNGDTVASDEELAEEGDAPHDCARSQWILLKQDALKIDLLNLANMDAGGLLAKGDLPVGTYRGIRLMISDALVRVGEKEANLKIPSGKASGLKIRAGFEVQEDGQVEIDLGFDLANSLRMHRKHGWILRPVLRAKKRRG